MPCPSCSGCSSNNTHRDPFAAKGCDTSGVNAAAPDEPQFQKYLQALHAELSSLAESVDTLQNSTQAFQVPIELPPGPKSQEPEPEPLLSPLTAKLRDLMFFTLRINAQVVLLTEQMTAP